MRNAGRRRGFTVLEALVTVGVLAVLTALAIPAISAIQRQLYMAEMDAYARQIYLAAQNELSLMKASGELEDFYEHVTTNYAANKLTQAPQDYAPDEAPAEGEAPSWDGLYAVPAEELSRALDSVVKATPEGGGAKAYIELNPLSGSVYSVFYAEDDFAYQESLPRPLEDRTAHTPRLGYYSGGEIPAALPPAVDAEAIPRIDIINGEELAVQVTFEELPFGARPDITITVKGKTSGNSYTSTESKTYQAPDMTLVLDSLASGNSFANALESSGLIPGEDLEITVTVEGSTSSGGELTGEAGPVTVNSLFASRAENGDITVSHLRHLNNLRAGKYPKNPALPYGNTVTQTGDIDFLSDNWQQGVDYITDGYANPLTTFEPIENAGLMERASLDDGFAYNGREHTISNLPIAAEGNAGLFASLRYARVSGVRLVDCSVNGGGGNAGMLAGQAIGSEITDCGAHLTYQGAGMLQWVESQAVRGGSNVGGLVGAVSDTEITDSYAAVYVYGGSSVGGLAGSMSGGSAVSHVYASGDVFATGSYAGGLVGRGEGAQINNCYSTSDVSGGGYVGGILGGGSGSISESRTYGEVTGDDTGTVGYVCGETGGINVDEDSCLYLELPGYKSANVELGRARLYNDLKPDTVNGEGTTIAYDPALYGNVFPFELMSALDGSRMIHYGDFPLEFSLPAVTLVYYERYADGSYGFYAEAHLRLLKPDAGEGDGEWVTSELLWEANSLNNDKVLVEDGYALLSTIALQEYSYELNPYATGAVNGGTFRGEVTVATDGNAATRDNSLLIAENSSIRFNERDEYDVYTGTYYVLNGAKLYRLPFNLQVTERIVASQFWERLMLSYDKLNEDGELEEVSAIYYYCPDFAKNAVNPHPDRLTEHEKPAEPREVYVRTARQLNGLGRSTYYWNGNANTNAATEVYMTFVQERDIDFGKYTTTYCKVPFDLMDTRENNIYRNKPIGRPMGQETGGANNNAPGNFRFTYDGNGNKIIDYCCETYTDYEFTGLFGEVMYGRLSNIIMETTGGAYIRANTGTRAKVGVGALAGLLYVRVQGDYNNANNVSTVENCAVSGYTIEYIGGNDFDSNKPSGVGGLVGFSFGNIKNSSAVSMTINSKSNYSMYVGGLVGAITGSATVEDCYAGMSSLSTSAIGQSTPREQTGGLVGGFYGLYCESARNPSNLSVKDCYTFWEEGESPVMPIFGIDVFSGASGEFGGDAPNYNYTVSLSNCYYLKDDQVAQTQLSNTVPKSYHQMRLAPAAARSYPISDGLSGRNYPFAAVVTNRNGDYVHYGDWPLGAEPRLVYYEKTRGEGGGPRWDYYYYDFLADDGSYLISFLDMENGREILDAGYAILSDKDSFSLTIGEDAPIEITGAERADGFPKGLYPLDSLLEDNTDALDSLAPEDGLAKLAITYTDEEVAEDGTTSETQVDVPPVYVNTRYAAAIFTENTGGKSDNTPFHVRTAEQLLAVNDMEDIGWYFRQSHDIPAGELEPAEGQTALIAEFKTGQTFHGLHSYQNEIDTVQVQSRITGLKYPLFGVNIGRLSNLLLTGVNIALEAGDEAPAPAAAPLALTNSGSISTCAASGRVSAENGTAAGLVHTNTENISNSYANCRVAGESAAGFVHTQTDGRIEGSYAGSDHYQKAKDPGYITGSSAAAGFIAEYTGGTIQDCYTLAIVKAAEGTNASLYGFGPTTGNQNYTSCYWLRDEGLNGELSSTTGGVIDMTLQQMRGAFTWAKLQAEDSHPNSGGLEDAAYSYPGANLPHYGDWPYVELPEGYIGVARLYTRQGGRPQNYASGQSVDREKTDAPAHTFATGGNQSTAQNTILILYSGLNGDLTDWEVAIGGARQGKLSDLTTYGNTLSNGNAAGYTARQLPYNVTNDLTVTLSNSVTGETFRFTYNNDTFTYTSTP